MGVRKDAALCGEYRMGVYDAPSPERNETRQQVLLQPLWYEKRGGGLHQETCAGTGRLRDKRRGTDRTGQFGDCSLLGRDGHPDAEHLGRKLGTRQLRRLPEALWLV